MVTESAVVRFLFERRVEFCETDAAGIAHFTSLMQYVEQAEHGLLRSLGYSVHSGQDSDVTWPRVHVEMDFAGIAKFEELLQIEVNVRHLGKSSVRYGFRISGVRGLVATAETVAVCCLKTRDEAGNIRMDKVSIPDGIRASLEKYLELKGTENA